MAKISSKAARERLELLAPEAADVLNEIMVAFREKLTADGTTTREQIALSKELRAIAAQVLDRGGVPAVRGVQTESRSLMLVGDARETLLEIAKRMTRLEPEDRELLLTMAPQLRAYQD